jgi:hypothetical protein
MVSVYIKKHSGEMELFDASKLKHSLTAAGASVVVADEIIAGIESQLYDGMTTAEIYKAAFRHMRKKEARPAARYALRRSLMTLGPTGFPFEKFLAHVFEHKGYKTMVGTTVQGKGTEHEIDVIAYNENAVLVMEAKFHNTLGIKTDTKVALYVKARFDDIQNEKIKLTDGSERTPTQGILVTNTEFTDSAEKYATCYGMGVISWDYPATGNLYDLIEETKAHPITVLTTLTSQQKNDLIIKGVVCCDQISTATNILWELIQDAKKIDKIVKEANMII